MKKILISLLLMSSIFNAHSQCSIDLQFLTPAQSGFGCGRISLTPTPNNMSYTVFWCPSGSSPFGVTLGSLTVDNDTYGTFVAVATFEDGCVASKSIEIPPTFCSNRKSPCCTATTVAVCDDNNPCTADLCAISNDFYGRCVSGPCKATISRFGQCGLRVRYNCANPSILWSNGSTCDSLFNLADGTYKVTVTSAGGCSSSDSVVINSGCISFGTNNCNRTWFHDQDGDGYYGETSQTSNSPGTGWSLSQGLGGNDCNDNNSDINPAATEICGNGIDEDCDGQALRIRGCDLITINVKDIRVNTTLTDLEKIPFIGVIAETHRSNEPNIIDEIEVSDEDGNLFFNNLLIDTFYTINFFYQDSLGIRDSISIDFDYRGYILGEQINEIVLPYTLLRQTRQKIKAMVNKPNYEIKYLLNFLDFSGQPRKVNNITDINILLDDWRTTDKVEIKDVIDNLGRIYVAMYAFDSLNNNAYLLSQLPSKAISEFVVGLADMIILANKSSEKAEDLDNVNETGEFIIDDILDLNQAVNKSLLVTAIKSTLFIMNLSSSNINDPKIKEQFDIILKSLTFFDLYLKDNTDIGLDVIKGFIKDLLNNKIYVALYEQHIKESDESIKVIYNKAKILGQPDETFDYASDKVIAFNDSSLLVVNNEKTESAINACTVLTTTADALDLGTTVNELLNDLSAVSNSSKFQKFSAVTKKLTVVLTLLKEASYLPALLIGEKGYINNTLDLVKAETWAYSPQVQFSLFGNPSQSFPLRGTNAICDEITTYNNLLDSIIVLIQNQQTIEAVKKSIRLVNEESKLEKNLEIETKRIEAVASMADTIIPKFDSIYTSFVDDIKKTIYSRAAINTALAAWFLDTTSVTYIDTLIQLTNQTISINNQACLSIENMNNITTSIQPNVRVKITSIEGLNEIQPSTTIPLKIKYQNFGQQTAQQTYFKIKIDGGFTLSSDSIFVGNVLPNSSSEITIQLTAPSIDTFSVYTISSNALNDVGDSKLNYIIAQSPEIINGVKNNIQNVDKNSFYIVPNPNNGEFILTGYIENEDKMDVVISNALGQIVYTKRNNVINGKFKQNISLINIPKGTYFLLVNGNKISMSTSFIKQ